MPRPEACPLEAAGALAMSRGQAGRGPPGLQCGGQPLHKGTQRQPTWGQRTRGSPWEEAREGGCRPGTARATVDLMEQRGQ